MSALLTRQNRKTHTNSPGMKMEMEHKEMAAPKTAKILGVRTKGVRVKNDWKDKANLDMFYPSSSRRKYSWGVKSVLSKGGRERNNVGVCPRETALLSCYK